MNFFRRHIILIIISILLVGMVTVSICYISMENRHQQEVSTLPVAIPARDMQEVKGVVVKYGNNPHGDIDRVLIAGGSGQVWVHFPPHKARWVLQAARLQTTVSVEFTAGTHGKDTNGELKKITDEHNREFDFSSIAPPLPSRGRDVSVSGSKFYIRKDEGGRTNGFVIGGMLVILPPHVADNLMPMIMTAKTITVKGQQRSDQDGFVNIDGQVLRPSSITIDSLTYLIQ